MLSPSFLSSPVCYNRGTRWSTRRRDSTLRGRKRISNTGKLFISFSRANIMKYVRNPTRKRMYIANAHKLSQNVLLFKEILVQRDKIARLLGYTSRAEFRMEKRMARSNQWVSDFLCCLKTNLLPQGRKEMMVLYAMKKRQLVKNGESQSC